jgi:XRE family aerobic/anaerobic benzoate catabolism transcriptional regulator
MVRATSSDDPRMADEQKAADAAATLEQATLQRAFGERVRMLRARRGMTRRALAAAASVSERYLAILESGAGNPSLVVFHQIAGALECSLAELLGDETTSSAEWLLLRELLSGRDDEQLRRAHVAIATSLGIVVDPLKGRRIALIGLRGAGKSTLGAMLAKSLDVPFVELSRRIEEIAGYTIREIYDLYGAGAYRRYERSAVEKIIASEREVVLATPGGLVSEPATFNLLLEHCTTVWLQALPEEHMARVAAQGDMRPMSANPEAMDDLRRILDGRSAFYAKANLTIDTAGKDPETSFKDLQRALREWAARDR